MVSHILTLQAATFFATALSLLALRFSPELLGFRSSVSLVLAIFLFHYTFLGLYSLVIYPCFLNPLRHLPGPKVTITLLGQSIIETHKGPGKGFMDLMEQYPDNDLLLIDIFRSHVLVAKPELLAELFVRRPYDFVKPPRSSGFLKQFLGRGLVIVEGDEHKFLRKNSLPAFSFRHIKNLYPMMWKKSITFTKRLRSEVTDDHGQGSDTPVDLNIWASKVTLDIIGVAGLGHEFNSVHNANDPLAQAYTELLDPSKERSIYFLMCSLFGVRFVQHLPWRLNQVFEKLRISLVDICERMMQEKRVAMEKISDDHVDILSMLMKSNNLSDTELKDQLLTYLAAGHETTSSSLSWACYLLSKHQDVQAALREEVQRNLTLDPSGEPLVDIASTLERLPYLNGVINEALRLYPTVPLTLREAIRNTSLGHYKIPKGTLIIVSSWAINRSPLIWGPDSTAFTPERWISDGHKPNQTGGASSNYQFLTFLHGPRSCIGQGFARAELRCLLAAMITSFSWELAMPDHEVVPGGTITIKPANGMYLRVKRL
ncbi:cytochrome P450 [Dactylonectria macrodidyma]|uniref:Cytochrome P450 n=1 Tax=Dactylonectria macrodidyma TaxID=307937 RepID=A0A9P9DQ15_9HYPO|nr:cytochrome P450 [Dactylonectria macrodidyma]